MTAATGLLDGVRRRKSVPRRTRTQTTGVMSRTVPRIAVGHLGASSGRGTAGPRALVDRLSGSCPVRRHSRDGSPARISRRRSPSAGIRSLVSAKGPSVTGGLPAPCSDEGPRATALANELPSARGSRRSPPMTSCRIISSGASLLRVPTRSSGRRATVVAQQQVLAITFSLVGAPWEPALTPDGAVRASRLVLANLPPARHPLAGAVWSFEISNSRGDRRAQRAASQRPRSGAQFRPPSPTCVA